MYCQQCGKYLEDYISLQNIVLCLECGEEFMKMLNGGCEDCM